MRAGFLSTGGKQTQVMSVRSLSRCVIPSFAIGSSGVMDASDTFPWLSPSSQAGPHFGRLSQETLNLIMSQLEPADLSNMASTCRGMAAGVEDGELWRQMTHRHFPCSR